MKLKRRGPLNLTAAEAPMAEPDNDLDMPALQDASAGGALARSDAGPAPARRPGGGGARFAASPALMRGPTPAADPARFAYLIAALVSVLWAGLAVFVLMAQPSALGGQAADRAVLVVLTVVPVGFIWLFAYALRQGAALAAEMRRARATSELLLGPAAQAAAEAGSLVEAVRQEIDAATVAAANAKTELTALRDILAEETGKLLAAAGEAGRTGSILGDALGREREQLGAISNRLDGQALAVSDAVTRQARMVTEASDLAQAQITESEAALAARAADLAAAAGEASDAARIASEDLSRQAMRLETATIGVADQTRSLEQTLTDQRASLVAVAHELRGDNEDFAIRLETQRAQLAEMLAKARHSVTEINEAASSGSDALRELADLAAGQARDVHAATSERIAELAQTAAARAQELAETAQSERDLLSAGALQSVGAVTEAARFERQTLEADTRKAMEAFEADSRRALEALETDTRRALDLLAEAAEQAQRNAGEQVEAARLSVVGLSEASFEAGQKAEAAYQARLAEAQGLIARSAELVDQAAGASAEKLERAAENARAVLNSLKSAVAEVEARVSRLPDEASAQAAAMKEQLATSFDDLLGSARAAAEETQAIDQAFQERVRRNYEMLSEAVRLMGVMSNPAQRVIPRHAPSAPAPAVEETPAAPEAPAAAQHGAGQPEASRPQRRGFFERAATRTPAPEPISRPVAPEAAARPAATAPVARAPEPQAPAHETPGLRPRLKLAPTESDENVSQMFEEAQAKPANEAEGGWTWQELLTSMDGAPVDEGKLADRLIGEIEALGVDLAAILPEARVLEIATVLETGDQEGARLVVRHLAPAAVRRLARKALTEPALRAHAERFVSRWREAIAETARRDPSGEAIAAKLASESGRAYLIFDAAVGDLP